MDACRRQLEPHANLRQFFDRDVDPGKLLHRHVELAGPIFGRRVHRRCRADRRERDVRVDVAAQHGVDRVVGREG